MPKRNKRLKSAIASYKSEIEKHFEKLEKDIIEKDEILMRYHIKEIDKSLIAALERKISLLDEDKDNENSENIKLIENYRGCLEEYEKKFSIE